jgi:hypothetical protein
VRCDFTGRSAWLQLCNSKYVPWTPKYGENRSTSYDSTCLVAGPHSGTACDFLIWATCLVPCSHKLLPQSASLIKTPNCEALLNVLHAFDWAADKVWHHHHHLSSSRAFAPSTKRLLFCTGNRIGLCQSSTQLDFIGCVPSRPYVPIHRAQLPSAQEPQLPRYALLLFLLFIYLLSFYFFSSSFDLLRSSRSNLF